MHSVPLCIPLWGVRADAQAQFVELANTHALLNCSSQLGGRHQLPRRAQERARRGLRDQLHGRRPLRGLAAGHLPPRLQHDPRPQGLRRQHRLPQQHRAGPAQRLRGAFQFLRRGLQEMVRRHITQRNAQRHNPVDGDVYALRAARIHPNGGQFGFACPPARTHAPCGPSVRVGA